MLADGPSEFLLLERAVEQEYRPRMLQELQSSGTGYPKILLFRKTQIQRREYIIPNPSQTDDECACFGGWLLRGVPCPCPKGEPRREELRKLGMQI